MYKGNSILGIIPAKKISKRIPGKNIKPLAGRPLLAWSIEEAKKSRFLDRIVVSTDSNEIARISKRCGADIPFMRPKRLCLDKISAKDVAIHTVHWFKKRKLNFDIVVLLQPTSPLRKAKDIDCAIKLFVEGKYDSLVGVTKTDKPPFWFRTVNKNNFLREINKSPLFIINGAIYISKTETLLLKKTFSLHRTGYYPMSRDTAIDIDTALDFKIAEMLLLKMGSKSI